MSEPAKPGSDEAPLTPELTRDPTDHDTVEDAPEDTVDHCEPGPADEARAWTS